MKKIAIVLLVLSSLLLIVSSCGKYEEGPGFSLRTKKARLAGTWKVEELKVDGETLNLSNIAEESGGKIDSFVFDKDGSGKMVITASMVQFALNFTWEFTSSKENLKIKFTNIEGVGLSFDSLELEILRLTNKEFWSKGVFPDDDEFDLRIKLKKDK